MEHQAGLEDSRSLSNALVWLGVMRRIRLGLVELRAWSTNRRKYVGGILLVLVLGPGCATVGVNNYQSAETLGKGKIKVGGAVELGRQMDAGIEIDRGRIEIENGLEWEDFVFPIAAFVAQYGMTGSTDVGVALTVVPYGMSASMAAHLKQGLIHTPGDLAVAIMPKAGVFGSERETKDGVMIGRDRYDETKSFEGYFLDMSIIISKRWDSIAIHLSPKYMYHYLEIRTEYRELEDPSPFENSDEKNFEFSTVGAAAGVSLVFESYELAPEASFLRVKQLPEGSYRWVLFPGVGVCLKF